MDVVKGDVSSSYHENQEEQFIKVSFEGTGPTGNEPARHIKVESRNMNFMHKVQGVIYLLEWVSEYAKKNDDTLTDMLSSCLMSKYKEMVNEKEIDKNN